MEKLKIRENLKVEKKSKIIVNKKVVQREMLDKTILLNLDDGEYYSLNPTAAAIWNMLSSNSSESEILAEITIDFEIDPIQVKTDYGLLILEFKDAGLIA